MGHRTLPLVSFNRGLVSRLGVSRADVKRIALSARRMTNWMPRVLGSMSLRPGLGYIGATRNNAQVRTLEFTFSTTDKALLELTDSTLRVWVNDALVTRVSVATAVVNGDFTTNLTNWTDNDEAGAASQWVSPGYMELVGTGTNAAIRDQQVTVAAGDLNKEHALRIVVARGPVTLRVGSTSGGEQYIDETTLYEGNHSLTFTPTGDFYIRFFSRLERKVWVDSCNVEAAGVMEVPTPWGAANLDLVRETQSADVLFVACYGKQQRRIERRNTTSWSVCLYQSDDGPFRVQNTGPGKMTPSVTSGNGTLTSSIPFFRSTHVGALFAVTSKGQTVSKTMGAVSDVTDSIRVTGITTDRAFTIILSGLTGTGNTVILERSFDNAVWTAVAAKSWIVDTTEAYTDGLDNQTVYYRLNMTVYAAGSTTAQLKITTGSIRGVCRVTDYTSSTVVNMEVLKSFGGVTATSDWEEGQWSDRRGWPSSVALYEGRLWWFGKDSVVGSISDAYASFDPETTGDSGVINRTLGGAQVDTINWALPLQRLVIGGQGGEYSCKSSSMDEILTPANFNPKNSSTQGSAAVRAVKIDTQGVFVQRGGTRLYTLALGGDGITYDYTPTNLTSIVPEIGLPGIVRIAVQRQPDTRIHCVRSDGSVAVLIFDSSEQVTCWVEVETDGLVEDVAILPGDVGEEEDHVYYVVARTIDGATVRYYERWAFESECRGSTVCKLADSFISISGALTTTVTGLGHLEGEPVVVWADGADVGTQDDWSQTYTVSGGQITLAEPATNIVVGLPYSGTYKSGKLLELQTTEGTPLNNVKAIRELGLIMADVHAKGLRLGADFDLAYMDDLPTVEQGGIIDPDGVRTEYDENTMIFPGKWETDSAICLLAAAPRPVTVLSLVVVVEE